MLLQHRAPTSGGQYHWVSEFAPVRVERFLSYVVGWLTFTGWQSAITAIGSIVAGAIQGLIALKNPDYGWERWHTTLLTIAVVSFCVFINVFVARRLPLVESFLALVHFAGLFIVIIVLWTLAPRNNTHDAFLQFSNMGGYPTDGLSFMVASCHSLCASSASTAKCTWQKKRRTQLGPSPGRSCTRPTSTLSSASSWSSR